MPIPMARPSAAETKAKEENEQLKKMLEESKNAYTCLVQACQSLVTRLMSQDQWESDENLQSIANDLVADLSSAENMSPFTPIPNEENATNRNCRTCGKIFAVVDGEFYCPNCSKSAKA